MNFVSYYNPDLEKLLVAAKQVPGCGLEERGKIYKEIQKVIADEVPYVFLNQRKDVLAYNKRIGNFKPGPWYYEPNQQKLVYHRQVICDRCSDNRLESRLQPVARVG